MSERTYALGPLFGHPMPDMLHQTPHARELGMQVVDIGPGLAVIKLPYRPEIIGDPVRGVVFGGAITAAIDQASGLAVACALEELVAIATIDLRVDYLRAAEPGLDLFARSRCYRVTPRVAFVRAVAYERDPDNPFASCLGAFMLGANRSGVPFSRGEGGATTAAARSVPKEGREQRGGHLVDAIPYARFLGVEVEEGEAGFVCVMPFAEHIVGNARLPAIHGGVLGALLELTALLRLIHETGNPRVPKPINFSVDYLRSGRAVTTRARARIFKLGSRIANVHVAAWQDDPEKPVATGNGKFLLRSDLGE